MTVSTQALLSAVNSLHVNFMGLDSQMVNIYTRLFVAEVAYLLPKSSVSPKSSGRHLFSIQWAKKRKQRP